MVRYIMPLVVFLVVVGFLWKGLELKPREVPSPFIGKPAPAFQQPQLHNMAVNFSNAEMLGKPWILNVWASWCVACRQEHPLLVEMKRQGLPLYGLNYKDVPRVARQWLEKHGNPYRLSVVDYEGKVGINYGVYGVPETFIIDKKGIIRDKVIGPVTRERLYNGIVPLMQQLEKEVI